jgi:hypothetical protein
VVVGSLSALLLVGVFFCVWFLSDLWIAALLGGSAGGGGGGGG